MTKKTKKLIQFLVILIVVMGLAVYFLLRFIYLTMSSAPMYLLMANFKETSINNISIGIVLVSGFFLERLQGLIVNKD